LAETGLLDGRSVTTHWRYADDVAARYPNLRVDPNPLFVRDGKFYTAAGVTSGIDLSLALVEEDWGRQVALTVARELVVYLRRSGSQEQFSEPLKFQMQAGDRFSDIAAWIPSNLQQDLSVEALAKKAALCPRHFRRRFKLTFGKNPGTYVECLRLGEVRRRLATTHQTVDAIATSVGFGSADSLRRVFRRHYGTAPAEYRERFNPTNGHSPARAKARAI
jgi:transcriptional regulator GlxA family with amidase domain